MPYNQTRLNDIYEECNKRYDLRIPPGYDDVAKKGRANTVTQYYGSRLSITLRKKIAHNIGYG